jgi:hypothetical protein
MYHQINKQKSKYYGITKTLTCQLLDFIAQSSSVIFKLYSHLSPEAII